ncbi:MAG: hypothetical protein KC877_00730 [Candidatus Kaiserbacteria bacterium]|nr:hypothetical protein [Candidatus Kaiserbacteria bacterium]MCB9815956.1 hypothetical protein [Candidatus Nomurabacteria bacterium]
MIGREQIEAILKINGIEPTAPDEQIRSVLLSARYTKDEVDTAMMVLRENTKTNKTRVDGLHKIFRTDEALRPTEISQLLGIDVEIQDEIDIRTRTRKLSGLQILTVGILSILLAAGGVLYYMNLHHIGLFHPSNQLTLFKK